MTTLNWNNKTIVISRTDSIGDVCLTLPICQALKLRFPKVYLVFLGKSYTKEIIAACIYVDAFLNWDDLQQLPEKESIERIKKLDAAAILHVFPNKQIAKWAFFAKIPHRIGTSHRLFHWFTCNHLLNFTRKNSDLHETQLNFKLLHLLGIEVPSFEDLKTEKILQPQAVLPVQMADQLHSGKKVILHCKSQGSAVEWGILNFIKLAEKLVQNDVQVIFTGTENEGQQFRPLLPQHALILDTSGVLTLAELITLIASADALVAASTGPLHIAGLLGKRAIGLFSSRRPIHPGRWKPLGAQSESLIHDADCQACKNGEICLCVAQISVERVFQSIYGF